MKKVLDFKLGDRIFQRENGKEEVELGYVVKVLDGGYRVKRNPDDSDEIGHWIGNAHIITSIYKKD